MGRLAGRLGGDQEGKQSVAGGSESMGGGDWWRQTGSTRGIRGQVEFAGWIGGFEGQGGVCRRIRGAGQVGSAGGWWGPEMSGGLVGSTESPQAFLPRLARTRGHF